MFPPATEQIVIFHNKNLHTYYFLAPHLQASLEIMTRLVLLLLKSCKVLALTGSHICKVEKKPMWHHDLDIEQMMLVDVG